MSLIFSQPAKNGISNAEQKDLDERMIFDLSNDLSTLTFSDKVRDGNAENEENDLVYPSSLSSMSPSSPSSLQFDPMTMSPIHTLENDDCTYKVSETVYWDPRGLSKYPLEFFIGEDRITFTYCADSADSECVSFGKDGKQNVRGTACMYRKGGEILSLGTYHADPKPEYAVLKTEGMEVQFTNGSTCKEYAGFQYIFRVNLNCDMTAEKPQVTARMLYTCAYLVDINTKFGCIGYTEPLDVDGGGLSIGTISMISFFSLLLAYFIVGFLVCKKKYGQSGMNAIPHLGFWSSVMSNTVTGCQVVYSVVKKKVCKKSSSSDFALEDQTSYDSI